MARYPRWVRGFLSEDDFAAISAAIARAEAGTSAEIRVHVERRIPRRLFRRTPDALVRARQVFRALGMHRAVERHAVLIYLAVADRKLAVIGDEGIHGRVGGSHWHGVRDRMVAKLREGAPRAAITAAIEALGAALAAHYPRV